MLSTLVDEVIISVQFYDLLIRAQGRQTRRLPKIVDTPMTLSFHATFTSSELMFSLRIKVLIRLE
jgi:hypothetical protein